MRTIRACLPDAQHAGQTLELPSGVFQHLVKVLRLTNGAPLEIFNGAGLRFQAELCDVAKKTASAATISELPATQESPLETHMGLVVSKGDRFDYALQKATELGVSHITPLISERCDVRLNAERAAKKHEHWSGVIRAACEQCYRDTLPTLHPITPLSDWAGSQTSEQRFVCHTAAKSPNWTQPAPTSVSFLIGPEGGLTEAEVTQVTEQGFQAWQLGPRILRTETAPIAMLSVLQMQWGDF